MMGESHSVSVTGALDKDQNSPPHRSVVLHSILHLASLFICEDDFWRKECFLMASGKWFGVTEYAVVEFFKMTGPLPASHHKWSCCYKAGSRKRRSILLAFWKGTCFNLGQPRLSFKFRISGLGILDKTWQFSIEIYTKIDTALCHLEFKPLCSPWPAPNKLSYHFYLWKLPSSFFGLIRAN